MYRRRYSAFESSTPRVGVLPSPPAAATSAATATKPAKLSVRFDPNLPKDNDSNNNLSSSENANANATSKSGRKARSLSNSPLYERKKRYGHLPSLMSSQGGPTASANYQLLNSANLRDLVDGQRHSRHVSRRDDTPSHNSHISHSNGNISHIGQNNTTSKSKPLKDGNKLKATLTAAMSSSLLRRKAHTNHSQQQQQQLQLQKQQQLQQQQLHQQLQQQPMYSSHTIGNAARHSLGHSPSAAASAAAAVQQTLVYERRRVSSAHSSPLRTQSPVHQCLLMRRRSDYSVEQIEQWKRQQQLLPRSGRKISVSFG